MRTTIRPGMLALALVGAVLLPQRAAAQLDPLLYLKRNRPTVLIGIDTSIRMQRDTNGDFRDDNIYDRRDGGDKTWEEALGVNDTNTDASRPHYRRKYVGLRFTDASTASNDDSFSADHIEIVGELEQPAFSLFDEATRITIARRGLVEAVTRNTSVVRFGLVRTRQHAPQFETPPPVDAHRWKINDDPVVLTNISYVAPGSPITQASTGDAGSNQWKITDAIVSSVNGSITNVASPTYSLLVAADAANANPTVLSRLTQCISPGLTVCSGNPLIPAGRESVAVVDSPLDNMLDDLKFEAARLIAADPDCRNTVAILVAGGGEGSSTNEDPVAKAGQFLNVSGRRVPIHVIGIAPLTAAERTQLQQIANASGGRFTEITAAMVQATSAGQPIPEFVQAVNYAISQAFGDEGDFNAGLTTTHQVTSPIVGTINLENAVDFNGSSLPNTIVTHPLTGETIPQRSNVIIKTGFKLPGFTGSLHAARVYQPVVDASKAVGYKFVSDGTKLWEASTPAAALRNIYTALPNGTVVAFTAANAATLLPYLRGSGSMTVTQAAALIDFIRSQPLGAIVDSTPAVMDPPSLDPPPDAGYPAFALANKNRRTLIWVGANDGMLHGIDGRLGKEVWAFIPFNLLPKLKTLPSGQPVGDFRYFVDGSPKVADVKVGGQWRTYLVMGQGPGGTFYQTFDVTLPDIASTAPPDSDSLNSVLSYFSSPSSVSLKWAFPQYQHFNWTYLDTTRGILWGDIAATAPAVAKTVGETWSDPAVGQIASSTSPFVVLTGSGFFRYTPQLSPNRSGAVAGNTFYVLDIATGSVLDSRTVGNDGKGETIDNCAASNNCTELKNALQADPVATGPADSRHITKAYLGDLDGRIWRFDLALNSSGVPVIQQMLNLYTISTGAGSKASDHPVFSSMATVSIGNAQQYLFVGTGSDLLPSNGINIQYAMLVILDQGASGTQTAIIKLEAVNGTAGEEKVTSFPAVAGDIVFFSTTTYKALACSKPDANLYAFTFIGGPAYDTNNDNRMNLQDSTKVRTTTGARATAPFIVDQHLVFGTNNSVEMFGDPQDFNNGVGQAGVRILSWREVR